MTMAQAAYANNSATVFQARFDRYLNDVLAAPMRGWQVNLALNVGGAVRALLIGAGLLAVALALTGVPIHAPLALAAAIFLLLVLFCSFGVVVGVYAESWDHTAFVTNLVILPLSFLGGVFYSVASLPSPWEEISRANPIHYLIDAVRYGFLGTSDTPIGRVARRHRGRSPRCRSAGACGCSRPAGGSSRSADAPQDPQRAVDQHAGRRRSSPRSRATAPGPRSRCARNHDCGPSSSANTRCDDALREEHEPADDQHGRPRRTRSGTNARARSTRPSRATSSDTRRPSRSSAIVSCSTSPSPSPWRSRHASGYQRSSAATRSSGPMVP